MIRDGYKYKGWGGRMIVSSFCDMLTSEDTEKSIRQLNRQVQSSQEHNLLGFINVPKNNR